MDVSNRGERRSKKGGREEGQHIRPKPTTGKARHGPACNPSAQYQRIKSKTMCRQERANYHSKTQTSMKHTERKPCS